jgi:hypothetical protein
MTSTAKPESSTEMPQIRRTVASRYLTTQPLDGRHDAP